MGDYYRIKGASEADMEVLLADNYIRQMKLLNKDYTLVPNLFYNSEDKEVKEIAVSPQEITEFLNKNYNTKAFTLGDVVESLDRLWNGRLFFKEGRTTGCYNLLPKSKYTATETDEQGRKITTIEYYTGVPTEGDVVHRFATVFDRFEYEIT